MNNDFSPALEVPAYLYNWMKLQSKSQFIGDMLALVERKGGLTENQIIAVKVKYIQAGNNIPSKTSV